MKKRVKNYLINLMKKSRKQSGFTLIEMVIVIAIIVMLLIIIAPNLVNQRNHAQKKTDEAFVSTLQTQIELYQDNHPGKKVTSLDVLKDGDYLTKDQESKLGKYEIDKDGKVRQKQE